MALMFFSILVALFGVGLAASIAGRKGMSADAVANERLRAEIREGLAALARQRAAQNQIAPEQAQETSTVQLEVAREVPVAAPPDVRDVFLAGDTLIPSTYSPGATAVFLRAIGVQAAARVFSTEAAAGAPIVQVVVGKSALKRRYSTMNSGIAFRGGRWILLPSSPSLKIGKSAGLTGSVGAVPLEAQST